MTTNRTAPEPKPHALHRAALAALFDHRDFPRALVHVPDGCETSLVGRWHAEQTNAELVVVSVPSRDLLAPTLFAYQAPAPHWRHTTLVVGPGPSGRRPLALAELGLPADLTTDVTTGASMSAITDFLSTPTSAARLIVTTHDQARDVAAALQQTQLTADLLVCDHAHSLTGQPRTHFHALLDSAGLPARHRLFLATTPVESTAWLTQADTDEPLSLQDADSFGEPVFSGTTRTGIASGNITPFHVQVMTNAATRRDHIVVPGIAQAIRAAAEAGARSILTLHSRADDAQRLASTLDGVELPQGQTIRTHHLRPDHLRLRLPLKTAVIDPEPDVITVVAVSSPLADAIDLPGFDAIAIADPRVAPRVIAAGVCTARKRSHKRGQLRVILPVSLPATNYDVDAALVPSPWREPWLVLRTLVGRTTRHANCLVRRSAHLRPPGEEPPARPRLQVRIPDDRTAPSWTLQPIAQDRLTFANMLKTLATWAEREGHPQPSVGVVVDDHPIGRWTPRVLQLFHAGLLMPSQVKAFEAIPGWAWSPQDAAWRLAAAAYRELLENHTFADDAALWTALATKPGCHPNQRGRYTYDTLAEFVSDTCYRRRTGTLSAHLQAEADRLPHWRWDHISDDDHTMLVALEEYVEDHRDFNVPHDYVHIVDDSPLGRWQTAVRRRRVARRLTPGLRYALARMQTRHPDATALNWDMAGSYWRLGYSALRQYTLREGSCHLAPGHIERMPDCDVDLNHWSALQQARHRAGHLEAYQAAALQQLRGWVWHQTPQPDERQLLAGSRTPESCGCDPCAAALAPDAKHGVDTAAACRHVRILRARGSHPATLAALAGLPTSTITELEVGTLTQAPPEVVEAVLTIPVYLQPDPLAGQASVPSAPTWDAIAGLRALGWPLTWVQRQTGTNLHRERDTIPATVANLVLHVREAVGDRRAPAGVAAKALPTLATILAEERQAS